MKLKPIHDAPQNRKILLHWDHDGHTEDGMILSNGKIVNGRGNPIRLDPTHWAELPEVRDSRDETVELRIVFVQPWCSYPGEYAPTAMHVADQFTLDANPKFVEEAVRREQSNSGNVAVSVVRVDIPMSVVQKSLNPPPVRVEGEIVEE